MTPELHTYILYVHVQLEFSGGEGVIEPKKAYTSCAFPAVRQIPHALRVLLYRHCGVVGPIQLYRKADILSQKMHVVSKSSERSPDSFLPRFLEQFSDDALFPPRQLGHILTKYQSKRNTKGHQSTGTRVDRRIKTKG